MYFELTDSFIVKASIDQTWDFFSNAENLPTITPEELRFTILTPKPIVIEEGCVLDYSIRVGGMTWKWRTLITEWIPKSRFVDLQLKGPYGMWYHTHKFEAHPEGTLCHDRVIYKMPVPFVGGIVNALFVKPQLRKIFEHRRNVIAKRLGLARVAQKSVGFRTL